MGKSKVLKTKYLIIGNSAGGIGAAEAIREVDEKGTLTIVSDEPYPAYSRPLISKYLSREHTPEGMLYRPADFYVRNNIIFLPGRKVMHLELSHQIAQLEDGGQITWEKLLLAVGGKPIVPRIVGMEREGIFTFTSLEDAKAIDEFLENGANEAVIIGGGLIGISVTEALVKRGIEVTIVELKERILNTILDEPASSIAEGVFQGAGVRIITTHSVVKVNGGKRVETITVDSGESIPCIY